MAVTGNHSGGDGRYWQWLTIIDGGDDEVGDG